MIAKRVSSQGLQRFAFTILDGVLLYHIFDYNLMQLKSLMNSQYLFPKMARNLGYENDHGKSRTFMQLACCIMYSNGGSKLYILG